MYFIKLQYKKKSENFQFWKIEYRSLIDISQAITILIQTKALGKDLIRVSKQPASLASIFFLSYYFLNFFSSFEFWRISQSFPLSSLIKFCCPSKTKIIFAGIKPSKVYFDFTLDVTKRNLTKKISQYLLSSSFWYLLAFENVRVKARSQRRCKLQIMRVPYKLFEMNKLMNY